jgi:hypothetical protein
MKPWFARADGVNRHTTSFKVCNLPFRPGHGDLTVGKDLSQNSSSQSIDVPSPEPAGLKFVKRGSLSAAGLRDERSVPMSSGSPKRLCADEMLVQTNTMARVRIIIDCLEIRLLVTAKTALGRK